MDEIILGIDLGTTNSLVAWMSASGPVVLRDAEGRATLPSIVSEVGDEVIVGHAARERALDHPEDTVYSVKRLMGRGLADLDDAEQATLPFQVVSGEREGARVMLRGRPVSPEEISARILSALKQRASEQLPGPIEKAVVTVPAYFDDAQRQATRLAGKLAGLDVVRIVNEPTAAALAYGLDRKKSGRVVVYDLGGGTFDVSVLEIRDGIFRVRATAGDTHLGGDDFDRGLMQRLLAPLPEGGEADARLLQAAKQASEQAKILLSTQQEVEYSVVDQRTGTRLVARVTRDEFEAEIADLVQRTIDCSRRALDDARLRLEELDAVVLVGGSTRVPLVRRRIEEFFGRRPYAGIDPDLVVALGAAVQADVLRGGSRDLLLLDVIPLSLGIETYGGAVSKVVMRNSPIPAQASDTFTTYVDDQTGIDVHVVQGERELVKDCRSLGRFRLSGLPPVPAGMPRVEVRFLVDENGVLTVSALERASGKEASIEVVPTYGLTDEEISRMVQESFQFAREDMEAHQLIDLRNECQTMLRATRAVLAQGDHGLESDAVESIRAVLSEVESGLEGSTVATLKPLYDRFVELTVPLAGLVMSEVAQRAISGRTIDEVLGKGKAAPVDAPGPQREKECGDLGEGFRTAHPAVQEETE